MPYKSLVIAVVMLKRMKLADPSVIDVMRILANLAAVGAFWLFGRALQNAGLQFFGAASVNWSN